MTIGWRLADLEGIPKVGVRVFSTFACGGGSSMGYKLAGCTMVGANDIDPEMEWHYRRNLHPPLFINAPISSLLTDPLPADLFDLDILDGSPPCSTFSMAGNREQDWGKKKRFREGQSEQVLSDLFFDFLALVERLRPKVVVAENVKGMLAGRAKGYLRAIAKRLTAAGYRAQVFLVNAADCGVPQRRERVFICAVRQDVSDRALVLSPNAPWVSAIAATRDLPAPSAEELEEAAPAKEDLRWWSMTAPGKSYADIIAKVERGRVGSFNQIRLDGMRPASTLPARMNVIKHWSECRALTWSEVKRLGSFPDDYHAKSIQLGKYVVGMSVPPRMMEAVANAVITHWLRPF